MTWSDAARKASAEARRNKAKGGKAWQGEGGGPGAKRAAANARRRAAGDKQPGGFWGGPGSLTPNQRRARERRG